MYPKMYFAAWALYLLVGGLFFATGNMTPVAWVAFGFVAFGMTFMGMMSVLPSTVGHNAAKAPAEGPKRFEAVMDNTSEKIRQIGAEIAAPITVDMRKPKFP
jgi:hypothetical protein